MITKRIIPCLDIKDGRTVKGIQFENIKDAGDPVELASEYARQGADELVFLDITATHEQRKTFPDLVKQIARHINIPFTVGGGISSVHDVSVLLKAGADKISVNSAAIRDPGLIPSLKKEFGSQCIVLSIDARFEQDDWYVYLNGGRVRTELNVIDWAQKAVASGAGEILLTSMTHDGSRKGFALDITSRVSEAVHVPVIASGGAGTPEDFKQVFTAGKADAALSASIFHYKDIRIPDLKDYLHQQGIPIRLRTF